MTRDEAIEIDFQIAIRSKLWERETVENVRSASASMIDTLIALGVLHVDAAAASEEIK